MFSPVLYECADAAGGSVVDTVSKNEDGGNGYYKDAVPKFAVTTATGAAAGDAATAFLSDGDGIGSEEGEHYVKSAAKYAHATAFQGYVTSEEDFVGLTEDELSDEVDGDLGEDPDGRSLLKFRRGTVTAKAWLDAHNKRRKKYHPKYGLQQWVPLKWSPSLARDAQAYADELARTCRFDHDYSSPQGENLIGGSSLIKSADYALKLWVEDEEFDYEMHGHFTQVLWRSTEYVGCAQSARPSGGCMRIVCRYLRPGNCNLPRSIPQQHKVMMRPNSPCGPNCPREGCTGKGVPSRTDATPPRCSRRIGAKCRVNSNCCGRRKCNPRSKKCIPCRKAGARCFNDSMCCGRLKCSKKGRFKRCGN